MNAAQKEKAMAHYEVRWNSLLALWTVRNTRTGNVWGYYQSQAEAMDECARANQ